MKSEVEPRRQEEDKQEDKQVQEPRPKIKNPSKRPSAAPLIIHAHRGRADGAGGGGGGADGASSFANPADTICADAPVAGRDACACRDGTSCTVSCAALPSSFQPPPVDLDLARVYSRHGPRPRLPTSESNPSSCPTSKLPRPTVSRFASTFRSGVSMGVSHS